MVLENGGLVICDSIGVSVEVVFFFLLFWFEEIPPRGKTLTDPI